ncbi:glycosyltransferase family 2 protein [Candidatus Woesearchaeota archaeon]|nr:glycosyltransferase family 2 protein [Candidatus Woesearchaeota archaeon]
MITILSIFLWIAYFLSLYFAVFWIIILLTKQEKFPRKKITEWPSVTIVIPAYNEEDSIGQTLNRVIHLDYPEKKIEIFVVNDGSTDKTSLKVKQIIKQNPDVSIKLFSQQNKGKGSALNLGLKHTRTEYFICLDADSFVEENALKKMLPYFVDNNVAAVLPTLKVYQPKNLLQKLQWYEYLINMFYKELMGKLDCVHVTPGPFSIYAADILKKIGGFDEQNITEDLEIAFRLQVNHYKIIQLLDTEVQTLAPSTVKELFHQRNRWFKGATLNALHYRKTLFNKTYGDFGMMQVPSVLISGILIVFLFIALIYSFFKPYVMYFINLAGVDFDIMTLLRNISINIKPLDLSYVTFFISLVMLIITITLLKKSAIANREKIGKFGSWSIFIYLIFYFIILGFIWIGVLFDIILGRRQKW